MTLSELRKREKELQAEIDVAYKAWRIQHDEAERLKEIWQAQRNAQAAVQREIIQELQAQIAAKETK